MKFSVIVPLYNKAPYIERTLRSIVEQSFKDFELIVIDDESTDGSYQIAEKFLQSYTGFCKLVKQKNSGVAIARNHGVQLAQGQYVTFLDADDWWESDFLTGMSKLTEEYPDAGLYGTNYNLVKNGRKRIAPIGISGDFTSGYINYCQLYAKTLCMPITSSSVAIPKTAFLEAGQFRSGISLGEDFDLWIRLALKYPVALLNEPLANYYQDLPKKHRATRRLHNPESHMLWNLDYLSEEEASNKDLKLLLDRLRSSGLFRYYLSRKYHQESLVQLAKINWDNIPQSTYKLYHTPLNYQRIRFYSMEFAANTRKRIIKLIKNH